MDEAQLDAAWAAVRSRWADDDAHRAFLDACRELPELAEAGRRYKVVLDDEPQDEVARRWRDEVVKRATVLAFAQLPRTRPARATPALWRTLAGVVFAAAAAAAGWLTLRVWGGR
jgi:hypothetical protein